VNIDPHYELRLRTPRLEWRLGTREQLVELGELPREGIHPSEEKPFEVPWTDRVHEEGFVESFVDFHETALRGWGLEKWSLNLIAFLARPSDRVPDSGCRELRLCTYGRHRVVAGPSIPSLPHAPWR
jgi:hypothetical protein